MTGRSGPLWCAPRESVRAVVQTLQGSRARVRFSEDGTLDLQVTLEGVIVTELGHLTVFHVQLDQRRPGNPDHKFVTVIYSRVIEITPLVTLEVRSSHAPMRRRTDVCQNCLGMYQPPERRGVPNHCGHCRCCGMNDA